jgi:hypothetical protein
MLPTHDELLQRDLILVFRQKNMAKSFIRVGGVGSKEYFLAWLGRARIDCAQALVEIEKLRSSYAKLSNIALSEQQKELRRHIPGKIADQRRKTKLIVPNYTEHGFEIDLSITMTAYTMSEWDQVDHSGYIELTVGKISYD